MLPATDTPYHYNAYGFNFVSDLPLASLHLGADPALETITIRRCDAMPEAPEDATQVGPFAWAAPNFLSLNVDQIVHFVARNGTTLHYRPYDGVDDASVQLFIMGSGLGALLMQRDFLVIHGNAIEIDGACMMCVGRSGVGKSTTAAGLKQRGYRVMSDDVCAIDDHGRVIPGMPHIKLWQEAADKLDLSMAGLDRVRPNLEKYGVPLGDAFCNDPTPIKVIYLLSSHQSEEITCETLTAHTKFMAIRNNTYRLSFLNGMGLGSRHFQQLSALAQKVTVKRIQRPAHGFHMDQLLDILIADATQSGNL